MIQSPIEYLSQKEAAWTIHLYDFNKRKVNPNLQELETIKMNVIFFSRLKSMIDHWIVPVKV